MVDHRTYRDEVEGRSPATSGMVQFPGADPIPDHSAPIPPSTASDHPEPARYSDGSSWLRHVLTLVWLLVAGGVLLNGLEYYAMSPEQRAFDPGHALWAPTGTVGHTLGVAGSLMMIIGVFTYSVRKRWRRLSRLGRMKGWLQVHIFLCTLGPFLVLLHTSFKFGGIVSIALWSMVVVVCSGIFGRYVYSWLPKTIQGQVLTAEALRERQQQIVQQLWTMTDIEPDRLDSLIGGPASARELRLGEAVRASIGYRLGARRRRRRLAEALRGADVGAGLGADALLLAAERHQATMQAALLIPFRRLFGYWHVIHLPLAILMFLILIVHVVVVAMFGYGWVL